MNPKTHLLLLWRDEIIRYFPTQQKSTITLINTVIAGIEDLEAQLATQTLAANRLLQENSDLQEVIKDLRSKLSERQGKYEAFQQLNKYYPNVRVGCCCPCRVCARKGQHS